VIEGEAGIGKSTLVAEFARQAVARDMAVLLGAGDAVEKTTPYHAWRSVFAQVLGVDGMTDPQTRQEQVLKVLQSDPALLRLAPLLSGILPLELQDDELTAQMTGQVRADNTRELLLGLLRGWVGRHSTVLLMEDAHWFDSASWALVAAVADRIQPLLLTLATRPIPSPAPKEFEHVLAYPGAARLVLEPLPAGDALALVCQRLGVVALPEPVAELIGQKAQGHPFFSEELAYALRDAGLIRIEGNQCRMGEGADLSSASFPDTVQGVITSRLDRLSPTQQLALKVASVIGRVFTLRIMRDVFPLEGERGELAAQLTALERLGLTQLETPHPNVSYLFKHVLTQESAYGLMLFAQRRELHRMVAEWYERTFVDHLSPYYPILAHHWGKAEMEANTMRYLGLAGEQALRNGAYRESIRFLNDAITLVGRIGNSAVAGSPDWKSGPHSGPVASWERQLGEAYVGLGELTQGREHTETALGLLGLTVPPTKFRQIVGCMKQGLVQLGRRCFSFCRGGRPAEQSKTDLEGSIAYERIAHLAYFSVDSLTLVHAVLRSLNLAERSGDLAQMSRSYASMCIALSLVPFHSGAEFYVRLAHEALARVDDLPARGWVFLLTGIYSRNVCRWERARAFLQQGADASRLVGDHRRLEENLTQMGDMSYHAGDTNTSLKCFEEVIAVSRQQGHSQSLSWGLSGVAMNWLLRGEMGWAQEALDATVGIQDEEAEALRRSEEIRIHGLQAAAYYRRGEAGPAERSAAKALELLEFAQVVNNYNYDGYTGMVEVYLGIWESANTAQAEARRACAALWKFSRVFPFASPRAWLSKGLVDWLSGHPHRARWSWHRALAVARRLAIPYEEGLAHYEFGRHLPAGDPNRRTHLNRACDLFTGIAAEYHLSRGRAAIEG
jgi:tetratricopeptide (TPR) repeat protein